MGDKPVAPIGDGSGNLERITECHMLIGSELCGALRNRLVDAGNGRIVPAQNDTKKTVLNLRQIPSQRINQTLPLY